MKRAKRTAAEEMVKMFTDAILWEKLDSLTLDELTAVQGVLSLAAEKIEREENDDEAPKVSTPKALD